ncbi:hypothetical protein [Rhodoplanes sp. Z2-YC6860]|uniref:hypothetical protein n=1 Tax=Rhodoplanes sp. Z2-YC6860 TaxID=674703 RepID=UPI00078EF0B1|nr:hypothetical protein [Rhodoplanes sp. Z2-YC6860]AMN40010.1 hypothetical protein RHPLAN_15550 [Rhodoplanes sp. Z2-YC6860]
MTSFRTNPKLIRATFAALLGVTIVAGFSANAARAEDDTDGEEPTLADTAAIRYILKGLGWRRDDDERGITYRERSPLVLPTGKDLPPPEKTSPATKTAGWPDDPDVKRAKKKKDDERKRKSYTEGVDDRPLLPSQVAGQPAQGRGDNPTILGSKNEEESARPSTVQELGAPAKGIFAKVWGNKEEQATFTGEPRRESLIEPPAGYRTPSPNQPFGIGKDSWTAPKIDRQEPVK